MRPLPHRVEGSAVVVAGRVSDEARACCAYEEESARAAVGADPSTVA